MSIKKELFFFGFLIVVSAAQIPGLGFCPDYLPKTGFDVDSFMGKWYEAEKYFTFSEVASRCVVTDYARAPSGKIYISNEVTNRVTGVKRIIEGNLDLAGKSGEGKLRVKYATTPIPNEQTFVVLDTDYDDYAVLWNCNSMGPIYTQNVWVMTRDRLPTGPTLQKAYGVLDKFRISRTFFVKTDQAGCALAASDLNAANGITGISTVPEAIGEEQKKAPVSLVEDIPASGVPGGNVPVGEQAAEEVQRPIAQKPITKAPIVKAPIAKAPIVIAPIIKVPVAKEPIIKAPIIKTPAVKAPVEQGTNKPKGSNEVPRRTPTHKIVEKMQEQKVKVKDEVEKIPKGEEAFIENAQKIPKQESVQKFLNGESVQKIPKEETIQNIPKEEILQKISMEDTIINENRVDKIPKEDKVDKIPKKDQVDKIPKEDKVVKIPKESNVDKIPKEKIPKDKIPKEGNVEMISKVEENPKVEQKNPKMEENSPKLEQKNPKLEARTRLNRGRAAKASDLENTKVSKEGAAEEGHNVESIVRKESDNDKPFEFDIIVNDIKEAIKMPTII